MSFTISASVRKLSAERRNYVTLFDEWEAKHDDRIQTT